MNKKNLVLIIGSILVLLIYGVFVLAVSASLYNGEINFEFLGNYSGNGAHSSLALDSNGIIHISTISPLGSSCDILNKDPCYITYGNNSGGTWNFINVTTDNRSTYSSIAIDSNDKIHLTYINRSTDGTKSSLRYCNNTAGDWSCIDIISNDNPWKPSIAMDTGNKAHIIYLNNSGVVDKKYLRYCNNTAGDWSCTGVPIFYNNTITSADYPEIAIDSNNKTHVVVLDFKSNNFITYCNNTAGDWSCTKLITGSSTSQPYNPAITIDANDNVHLVYINQTSFTCPATYNHTISYMNSSNWSNVITLETGCFSKFDAPDIAIDFNNKTHITYSNDDISNRSSYYVSNIKGNYLSNMLIKNISGTKSSNYLKIKKGLLANSTSFSDNIHFFYHKVIGGNHFGTYYANMLIDSTNPNVTINIPLNETYTTITIDFNVTAVDNGNVSSCWFTINSGVTNYTLLNSPTSPNDYNLTNSSMPQGSHTAQFYCDDTYILGGGNVNDSEQTTFFIDSLGPATTIYHPLAQNYNYNQSINLNLSSIDAGVGTNSTWYKVVNSSGDLIIDNTTIPYNTNTSFNLTGGDIDYNLTVYSNDSLGNLGQASRSFGIRMISPATVLDSPTDNGWFASNTNLYFNFTSTDSDGLDTCELWGNWTGDWHKNYTWTGPETGVQNFTKLNISDSKGNLWNVNCSDTLDNWGWALANFTFGVDTITPTLTIATSGTYSTSTPLVSINATDTNRNLCLYNVTTQANTGIEIVSSRSIANCQNATMPSISDGSYYIFVSVNDLAENTIVKNSTFVVDTSTPAGSTGGGVTTVTEEKTFCGDNMCQKPNDFGVTEDFYNCPQDCPGVDLDAIIKALTINCFDGDDSTICFWFQRIDGAGLFSIEESVPFNFETAFVSCFDKDEETSCWWGADIAVLMMFLIVVIAIILSMVVMQNPKRKAKIPSYFQVKYKTIRRRWKKKR